MIDQLQNFVESTDAVWQWLAIMLAAAIPFVESYFGAALGVVAGVSPPIAIIAAIIGNVISMVLLVLFGERIRHWRKLDEKPLTNRQEKTKKFFNKYGVIGVSLLGQTVLPSQITSMTMVTFGVSKWKVIFWQVISIIMWGVLFGLLTAYGVDTFLR